jgi:hypothetical protein
VLCRKSWGSCIPPETPSSTRSSTPSFSDHASDNVGEIEKEDATENYEHPSREIPDDHAEQAGGDDDDDDVHAQISDGHNPATVAQNDRIPLPEYTPVAMANVTVDEIAEETSAPNRRPKRAIKPRMQTDCAEIDDSDCANSDCDDPKRPGELIKCAGLGCQTKVCTHVTFSIGSSLRVNCHDH